MVAPGGRDAQPGGQLEQIGEHIFVQLQIGQFALAAERADVDLVRRKVLRVSSYFVLKDI